MYRLKDWKKIGIRAIRIILYCTLSACFILTWFKPTLFHLKQIEYLSYFIIMEMLFVSLILMFAVVGQIKFLRRTGFVIVSLILTYLLIFVFLAQLSVRHELQFFAIAFVSGMHYLGFMLLTPIDNAKTFITIETGFLVVMILVIWIIALVVPWPDFGLTVQTVESIESSFATDESFILVFRSAPVSAIVFGAVYFALLPFSDVLKKGLRFDNIIKKLTTR